MKNYTLAYIADYLFLRLIIFCASFVWCRYYINDLAHSLLSSAVITLGVCVVIDIITLPRRKRALRRIEKSKGAKKMCNQFLYNGTDYTLEHLQSALSPQFSVVRLENSLLVQAQQKTMIFPHFIGQKLTASELISMLIAAKNRKVERVLVFCGAGFVPSALAEAHNIQDVDAFLLDEIEVLDFLSSFNAVPKATVEIKRNKLAHLRALKELFICRKRVKGYLYTALIVLAASYFAAYQIYYIICATMLFLLSLVSYFFTNRVKNKPAPKKYL